MYARFTPLKSSAQAKCGSERRKSASPSSTAITPEIIGLRTQRYGPDTTSARGGSHGAKVPSPFPANSRRHATNRVTPIAMNAIPAATPSDAKNESGDADDTGKRRA